MADMTFWPVCCVSEQTNELLDKFLNTTYKGQLEIWQDEGVEDMEITDTHSITVVTDVNIKYTAPSVPPLQPSTNPSPFLGKDLKDCAHLLKEIYDKTGSELCYHRFFVVDERSAEDDTVLLVGDVAVYDDPDISYDKDELKNETGIQSVRVSFHSAAQLADLFSTGHMLWTEARSQVGADGVWRCNDK